MNRLERARRNAGYTQTFIAKKCDISVAAYCQYEKGNRSISATRAETIARLFDMSVDDLFLPLKFTVSKSEEGS